MKSETIPLLVPGELVEKLRSTAKRTQLSMADVMRQSMKIGLPRLEESLSPLGRVTNVDPLPEAAARKLYSEREDDMESIRQFIAAQPREAE